MSFSGDQYPSFASKVITTRGDIIRGNSSGDRARYGIGAANTVLTSDGTDPSWAAHGGVPTTTKGDISGFSTTQARIPVGTNNYSILADSAQALGLKWAASPTSVLSTTGDILAASSANVLSRIQPAASGTVLTSNGAGVAATFQAAGGGGVWTSEGSTTLTDSTTDNIDITLSTALVASKAKLYYAFNGAMTGSNDILMQCNGDTGSNFVSSFLSSENGAALTVTLQTETSWRVSNQYNDDFFYGYGYFQIVEDEAGNDRLVGTFRTSGSNATRSGNYRMGNFFRDDTVTSLTSLKLFCGADNFQTGTTLSLYSLSKT